MRGTMNLLLVENDPIQGETLPKVLTMRGHTCDWAPNAEAALALLAVHHYEALLIDQNMPGLDGVGLVRRLRQSEATRRVPVLLLTASAGCLLDTASLELAEMPPAEILTKPCDAQQIEAALSRLAAGASHSPPAPP